MGLLGVVLVGLVGAAMAVPGPATAAATTTVAYWQMNEGPGAGTMQDSGPYGLDGEIGSLVQTGASHDGATGYRWSLTSPTQPPPKPERLIEVDSDRLNPGTADYAVTVRYRTDRPFGNLIQKGQNKTVGGYFKIELPKGYVTCMYKDGAGGQRAVQSEIAINDGAWHTIRCERTQGGVRVTIDGGYSRITSGATGSISNSKPLSIAGKRSCDQISVTCDYFVGDIDWVRIETSSATPPPPPPPTGPDAPQFALRTSATSIASVSPIAGGLSLYGIGTRGTATLQRTLPTEEMPEPWGLAALPGGGLAAADGGTDTIRVWDAPGTSEVSRTIRGDKTRLDWPEGIAVDSAGRLHVANALDDSVTVFAPGASGNAAPIRRIVGAATKLDEPVGVALDAAGQLLVANSGDDSVTVFAAGANGNAAPIRRIKGAATGLDEPYQVAVAAGGAIQTVDADGMVRTFGATATGDVSALATSGPRDHVLVDPGHGLSQVAFLGATITYDDLRPVAPPAPDLTAPTTVRHLRVNGGTHAAKRVVRWKAPGSDGGAPVLRYRVVVKHHGKKSVVERVGGRKAVLERSSLPRGRSKILVRAENSVGAGPKARVKLRVR